MIWVYSEFFRQYTLSCLLIWVYSEFFPSIYPLGSFDLGITAEFSLLIPFSLSFDTFFVFEETVNLYRKVVIPVWYTNQYPNRHLPKMVLINQRLILRSLSYKFCLFANATHKINHARRNLTFTCKINTARQFLLSTMRQIFGVHQI